MACTHFRNTRVLDCEEEDDENIHHHTSGLDRFCILSAHSSGSFRLAERQCSTLISEAVDYDAGPLLSGAAKLFMFKILRTSARP